MKHPRCSYFSRITTRQSHINSTWLSRNTFHNVATICLVLISLSLCVQSIRASSSSLSTPLNMFSIDKSSPTWARVLNVPLDSNTDTSTATTTTSPEVVMFSLPKLFSTIFIFLLTFSSCLLPFCLPVSVRLLGILNTLAGGVFLAASLCHLLPDADEEFVRYIDETVRAVRHNPQLASSWASFVAKTQGFPWAGCLAGFGFILTLLMEQLAHFMSSHYPHAAMSAAAHGHSHHVPEFPHNHHHHQHNSDLNELDRSRPHSSPTHSHHNSQQQQQQQQQHHHHHHHNQQQDNRKQNPNTCLIIAAVWLTLSFHSVLEGIALGAASAQHSSTILLSILAHKGLESFSLGTNLIRGGTSTFKYVLFCTLFACMTPAGIIIGSVVSSTGGIFAGVLSAICCGTFLFVAIVEVILPELQTSKEMQHQAQQLLPEPISSDDDILQLPPATELYDLQMDQDLQQCRSSNHIATEPEMLHLENVLNDDDSGDDSPTNMTSQFISDMSASLPQHQDLIVLRQAPSRPPSSKRTRAALTTLTSQRESMMIAARNDLLLKSTALLCGFSGMAALALWV